MLSSPKAWFCCDRCGFDYRRSQGFKEWTGLVVCGACLDPRPPQLDPPRVGPEGVPLPDARPEPDPIFLEDGDVTEDDL